MLPTTKHTKDKPKCIKGIKSAQESGLFLIIVAGAFVGILSVIGLAVDSATLFRANLAAQNAADAASSAAAGFLATKSSPEEFKDKAIEIAYSVGRANIRNKYVKLADSGLKIEASWDGAIPTSKFEVQIDLDAPLLLLRFIPGMKQTRAVSANATTNILPAIVTLMLDTSGSMICPIGDSVRGLGCDCPDINGDGVKDCQESTSRLGKLKEAAIEFVDRFDERRDKISLIAFNTGAKVFVPYRPLNQHGFNKDDVKQGISNLKAGGMTNPSDALLQAYLETKNINGLYNSAHVLFTDGPATAARMLFAYNFFGSTPRTHGSLFVNNPLASAPYNLPSPIADYDYYSWAAKVIDPDYQDENGNKFPIAYYVPQRLVPAPGPGSPVDWEPYGYGAGRVSAPPQCSPRDYVTELYNPDGCPVCSYFYWKKPAYAWLCFRSSDTNDDGKAPIYTPDGKAWLLNKRVDIVYLTPEEDRQLREDLDLTENDPVDDEGPIDNDPIPPIANAESTEDVFVAGIEQDPEFLRTYPFRYRWWKHYYEATLAMAETLRAAGGVVFTLGFGAPADSTNDAYQDIADPRSRKDYFLRRLAFDQCGKVLDDPKFQGIPNYETLTAEANQHRQGLTFTSTDGEDLKLLFSAVATKIKLRLTN